MALTAYILCLLGCICILRFLNVRQVILAFTALLFSFFFAPQQPTTLLNRLNLIFNNMYFLQDLKNWEPFKIDALGLITIVGMVEVDRAVGRLIPSFCGEFSPLLGAFTVASNQITETLPGFALYNITDGIKATDLTGWFTRWLQCQPLQYNGTVIKTNVAAKIPLYRQRRRLVAASSNLILMGGLLALAGIMGDWWGFVNGLSMAISVFVRFTIVELNRHAIDSKAQQALEESNEQVKLVVTLPNGKIATIYAPRTILLHCFLTQPRPAYPRLYQTTQLIGWAAFGTQIISLGMSSLVIQIFTVVYLAVSTLLVVYRVGDNEARISPTLSLDVINSDREKDFRALAYAKLNLSDTEEDSMVMWNLFPHKSNEKWWTKYNNCKGDITTFQTWDRILSEK